MVSWRWYHDFPVRILFDHLLRIVSLEDRKSVGGITIPQGGVLVQIDRLAKDNGLTLHQVRLALKKLSNTNDIIITLYARRGSLVVINNFEKYYCDNRIQIASKAQSQIDTQQEDTNKTKNQIAPKAQSCEKTAETNDEIKSNVTQIAPKAQSQHIDDNNITEQNDCLSAPKAQQNGTQKEPENKESSPTPLKENKEEEKECEKEKNTKKEKPTNYPFELFWNTYDKKFDKQKCEKAWAKMSEEDRAACMKALPSYIASTQEIQYRRYPYTYLHNRSWENDIIQKSGGQQLLPLETPLEKALREFDNE